VDALVAMHSSDPATVHLGLAARTRLDIAGVEGALYERGDLVRMLGMRRTLFVIDRPTAPIVQAACTREIARRERTRLVTMVEEAGIARDGAAWIRAVEKETLAALASRSTAFANDLSKVVPGLREKIPFGEGKKWAGTLGLSTRILWLLAADGHIERGRPRGSWISSQYEWTMATPTAEPPAAEARAELARRWLRTFGPGTEADVKWWTGWTLGQTRAALGALDVVEVALDEGIGYVLADDIAPVRAPKPSAALLPALDTTVMGWSGRAWYLGPHAKALFDRNGNAGPTIWYRGRVVGGWGLAKDGSVALRVLEDVGSAGIAAVEAAAQRVENLLGGTRFVPRFRTPLEQTLSA
jgi:hypothetical protein